MGVEWTLNSTKPKIITFISGKGGSGKTTVAIAITKLLADMGHSCLLVDFDLATNGGSYFFKNRFMLNSKGIYEILSEGTTDKKPQLNNLAIDICNNFKFIASKSNLFKKDDCDNEQFFYKKGQLKNNIILPLLNWATENSIKYILVDCTAGYTQSSLAAVEMADVAIIVTEPDSISSDAADNLLIQLGNSLPNEKRYLVNKIDVRDAETYRNMRNVFQSINRLPPLPFDFNVRNAFGARQIPIDINKPSPLLFALFETMKYIFIDIYDEIESYKSKHIDALFKKYDDELTGLLKLRDELEEKQALLKTRKRRANSKIINFATILFSMFAFVITLVNVDSLFSNLIFDIMTSLQFYSILVSTLFIVITFYIKEMYRVKDRSEDEEVELSQKMITINRDLDHYRSLLLVKSKDYLLDMEIVRKNDEEQMRPQSL